MRWPPAGSELAPPARRGPPVHAARRDAGPGVLPTDGGLLSRGLGSRPAGGSRRDRDPAGWLAHSSRARRRAPLEVDDGSRPPSTAGRRRPAGGGPPRSRRRRSRRRLAGGLLTPTSGRTCRRASPSTRPRPSRRCGRRCRASATSCSSIRSRSTERRTDHRRAGREVVVAGQLPQPGLLPAQGREVARRQPFTSKDVKFTFDMVREAPDAAGQAPHQPAQGLVRQRRGDRGARPAHGGLPPQAAAALAAPDARLRLLARSTRRTCRRQLPHGLRGHRAPSSSRSGARASSSTTSRTRTTS